MRVTRSVPLAKHLMFVGTLALMVTATSCEWWEQFMEGWEDCEAYQAQHQYNFEQGGLLKDEVPDQAVDYAMAMILNRAALNELFRRLDDNELPTLTDSTNILGMEVSIAIEPDIPLFGISGSSCDECLTAEMEFHPQIAINGYWFPAGGGTIGFELPSGMEPIDDHQTAFVAYFQHMVVDTLDMDLGDPTAEAIYDSLEPIITMLVTDWLQSRFHNAPIATFDSWQIGEGEVLLAPRGPYVYPDLETVVLPIQTNLYMDITTPPVEQFMLPAGADMGFILRPELLVAMAKRMNYENVIPEEYDEAGEESEGGGVKFTIQSMTSDRFGWLQTDARLYFLEEACGTADMQISMEMSVSTESFHLAVADFHITEGQGVGLLLSESDWLTSAFINALLETLEITINYSEFMGGEAQDPAEMAPVEFTIDGYGIGIYANFLMGY